MYVLAIQMFSTVLLWQYSMTVAIYQKFTILFHMDIYKVMTKVSSLTVQYGMCYAPIHFVLQYVSCESVLDQKWIRI